jgi:transposase
MRTISLDLRERILASYDKGEGTRPQIARRYRVSLGMVKKLLQQRRLTGDIAPLHGNSGRKPVILPTHQNKMRALLARKPKSTLKDLRKAIGLHCSLPAIHYALRKLNLTTGKKKPASPARRPTAKPPAKTAAKASVKSTAKKKSRPVRKPVAKKPAARRPASRKKSKGRG